MTNKEVQLAILRHLEAGNTQADEHILTGVPVEQRNAQFRCALPALENRGFLCPKYAATDKPELSNAYVSADGRAFIRENTPDPLIEILKRKSLRWLDVIFVVIITGLINLLITLYLTGNFVP